MLILKNNEDKQEKIIERVEPLAMEAESMMEVMNENNEDLDDEDQEYNIDKMANEGDLSPKKIKSLSAKHGSKQKKKKIK